MAAEIIETMYHRIVLAMCKVHRYMNYARFVLSDVLSLSGNIAFYLYSHGSCTGTRAFIRPCKKSYHEQYWYVNHMDWTGKHNKTKHNLPLATLYDIYFSNSRNVLFIEKVGRSSLPLTLSLPSVSKRNDISVPMHHIAWAWQDIKRHRVVTTQRT